jgi:hypothetical protein
VHVYSILSIAEVERRTHGRHVHRVVRASGDGLATNLEGLGGALPLNSQPVSVDAVTGDRYWANRGR